MQAFLRLALLSPVIHAHMTAWTDGMYCLNGTSGGDNQNTNDAVNPLYNLPKSEWWMHHNNKCDEFPPAPGKFLEIPAGGNFTVEIATNRAFTHYSYDGRLVTAWGDGKDHPDDYSITNLGGEPNPSDSGCIPSPNLHTQNETMAAGTVFAISYESDIKRVTPEKLVVFTVVYHTPFKLLATYQVPAALPACPEEGCHCVWGWVPNHCGEPNMYMMPHKCKVTGATSTTPLAPAVPPQWCDDDETQCVQGPKQMIFWNQQDGNNVVTTGTQRDGDWKSPGYNMKMGFREGKVYIVYLVYCLTKNHRCSE
ncbi:hypothetical protein CPB86DRAFT_695511 [Serendipita vermifera]|nr:hypothetical protein CPB86DRAFT_695511 [Serendipita vermifera]